MQSKTLCFNATLFRKNLARFWPLWGMASFLGALFPLALLLDLMRTKPGSVEPLEFTQAYYSVLSYGVPIVSLLYAALVAMMVWSYLYNARSVGLMHTLPIRREGLFATNFLSGMAMMLIPYAVTGGLCVLISLGYGGFDPAGLAVTVLGVLGESFFYFASATFAAFIVGNLFALPAVYFLLHFLAVMLDWLVSSLAQGFIFGFSGNYTGVVEWLSPTVYLEGSVRPAAAYEEILQEGDLGNHWTRSVMTDIRLDGLEVIGAYALVGAVLLALGYLLYRRRKSETAGDVVAVGALRPVFCCGVTALAALLGGIALYEIFWRGFQGGDSYDAVPMAVCMRWRPSSVIMPRPCCWPRPCGCSGAAGRASSRRRPPALPCAACCTPMCWASRKRCRPSARWKACSCTQQTTIMRSIPGRRTLFWSRFARCTRPSRRTGRTSVPCLPLLPMTTRPPIRMSA